MITNGATAVMEHLLNQHINESSTAQSQLRALADRTLLIDVKDMNLKICFKAEEAYLRIHGISRNDEEKMTATISGTPLTFLRLLRASTADELRASGATIYGDTETIEGFSELLRLARPEIEEEISLLVGDVLAYEISKTANRLTAWGNRALQTVAMNTSEFIQEESSQLPPRLEVEGFSREVEVLREDTDRAAQRVDRLLAQKNGRTEWGDSD
jgi:ubiquinone biosynthesis accessory factor UbiJ|tara:strand:- start:71 stop:712 length:642 start_codon:yes stop_codon:yes gene_type:complete